MTAFISSGVMPAWAMAIMLSVIVVLGDARRRRHRRRPPGPSRQPAASVRVVVASSVPPPCRPARRTLSTRRPRGRHSRSVTFCERSRTPGTRPRARARAGRETLDGDAHGQWRVRLVDGGERRHPQSIRCCGQARRVITDEPRRAAQGRRIERQADAQVPGPPRWREDHAPRHPVPRSPSGRDGTNRRGGTRLRWPPSP